MFSLLLLQCQEICDPSVLPGSMNFFGREEEQDVHLRLSCEIIVVTHFDC